MSASALDFTFAYLGRVTEDMTEPYNLRASELAARLDKDIGAGLLPWMDFKHWDGLKKDLAGLLPKISGFEHMLVLGIGGSALGARALQKAFFPQQDRPGHAGPWLWVADNVDAPTLSAWLEKLPPEKTLAVTISKSGGTIETISQYFIVRKWLAERLGDAWPGHMIVVTDPQKGFLREEAGKYGYESLPVPQNMGGRYSVFSAVGLLPAAFLGMDVNGLVAGAKAAVSAFGSGGVTGEILAGHPAWKLAVWNRALMDAGYSQLIFFCYIPLWVQMGDWFAQLWAESLGKKGLGSMPIPAVGVTDQHSVNQMFLDGPKDKGCLFVTCPGLNASLTLPEDLPEKWSYIRGMVFGDLLHAESLGTQMALTETETPLVEVRMSSDGPTEAGRLMALLEATTLLTGWLLNINPLDQPAVELGKRLAKARLGADGLEEEKSKLKGFLSARRRVVEF